MHLRNQELEFSDNVLAHQFACESDVIVSRSQSESFKRIAECFSVLLPEIGAFLAGSPTAAVPGGGSPRDIVHVFCLSARFVREEAAFAMNGLWEQAYRKRWPAFHQAVSFNSKQQDWRTVYEETQMGRCEFTLEVFDREKKAGFAMAAMPAQVQFTAVLNGFMARYISASSVRPELIPLSEARRLRFCPASARDRLQPTGVFLSPGSPSTDSRDALVPYRFWRVKKLQAATKNDASTSDYPYRVLRGTEGIEVGRGVELQWKMQEHSPFGWWYGTVEAVRKERGQHGERAVATISFRHFPRHSPWYQVDVRFGDGEVYPCMLGGTTGGIRPVSPEEDAVWKTFFPREEVMC